MPNRILSKVKPNVRKVGDKRYPSRDGSRIVPECGPHVLRYESGLRAKPDVSVQEYPCRGVLSIDMRYVPPLPRMGCEYAAAAGFRRPPQRV